MLAFAGARMVNYSRTGLSFETNEHLHQGAEIYIGIENSPYASPASRSYECYRAKIIWRRELETVFFKYGYVFINYFLGSFSQNFFNTN